MRRVFVLGVVGVLVLVASAQLVVRAQSDAKPLSFEVASVKPASFPGRESSMASFVEAFGVCSNSAIRILGNRVAYPFVSVCGLIRLAYDVRDDEIVGPDWIRAKKASALYALDAAAPSDRRLAAEVFVATKVPPGRNPTPPG